MVFGLFKKKNEPISWFAGADPAMLAAITQAQASFDQFITAVDQEGRRVVPAFDAALVKYAFPATKKGVAVEHMFLSNIEKSGETLCGVINSAPMYTDDVAEGDKVVIDHARVSDWLYVVNGVGIGGYTFRLMWKNFSARERASYGQQPPFIWLQTLR